jgi:hypothetical protein
MKQAANRALLGLFFNPEDSDMFPRNVDLLSMDHTALYPRIWNCSVNTELQMMCREEAVPLVKGL